MGYKDKETQRQYQKEWHQRKKAGIKTEPRPKVSKEHSLRLKREREARYRKGKRDIISKIWGDICYFCGLDGASIIHRLDGEKHKLFSDMSKGELKRYEVLPHLTDEYVRLCKLCHKGIHWAMKYIGMNWHQIKEVFNHSGDLYIHPK